MLYGLRFPRVMEANQASGRFFQKVRSWVDSAIAIGLNLCVASDHIRNLEQSAKQGREVSMQFQALTHELEAIRRENETLRGENNHFYQEMQHYRDQARPSTATAMQPQSSVYPQSTSSVMGDPTRSLPPLTNGIPAANSMQGVQYTDERR